MDKIEEPVSTIATNDKPKNNTNDPRILKARGGDPNAEDPTRRLASFTTSIQSFNISLFNMASLAETKGFWFDLYNISARR